MLIGRENEQKKLKDLFETDKSEFVALPLKTGKAVRENTNV